MPKGIKGFQKGHRGYKYWLGKRRSPETIAKIRASLKGRTVWNKGKKCPQFSGENHPRWKGGKYGDKRGYIYVLAKNHPLADTRGYVFEHRLVMEKKIGRSLNLKERIHHINGIPDDNRPENLQLFSSQNEHIEKTHKKERNKFGQFI